MVDGVKKLAGLIWRARTDPAAAFRRAHRKFMPVGIVAKDPEANRIRGWNFGDAPRLDLREILPGVEGANIKVFRSYDRTLDLSLDAQEVLAMCSMAAHAEAASIIEIGTSDGNTTLNLIANGAPGARLTTIDLPEDWQGGFEIRIPDHMNNMTDRARVGIQYRQSDYRDRVTQVFGDSAKVDFAKLPGPFDFAFIDGCHAYDYVIADTENCVRHMKPGGLVVWHDYGMLEEVSRAVDEWAAKTGIPVSIVRGTRLAVARLPG